MARFTTRVLLKGNPTYQDYEKLHRVMKAKGFSRVIQGSDNNYYWLPNAEYDRSGNLTLQQVHTDAAAAAGTVWTSCEILVTEGNCMWSGLEVATAAQAQAS
ncbi:MAG: DUF2622 domain-containing protein [Planctomycetes bacterium]|nr:DUF2622 domain-containing protein [Planctomycetota bacterium]